MYTRTLTAVCILAVCAAGLFGWSCQETKVQPPEQGNSSSNEQTSSTESAKTEWTTAVDPKPLTDNVNRGLAWLSTHQLDSGAWGQGEESGRMGGGGEMKATASVADTCLAALALVRSGSSPSDGPYAANILRAVEFVCLQVEAANDESLYITKTRGTRVQAKLGAYIDTFLASMFLSEVTDTMPDEQSAKRVGAALQCVIDKIQKHQKADGTWAGRGWAPALAQSMGTKGLNMAAMRGADVSTQARIKAGDYAAKQYDRVSEKFDSEGSAGVDLYAAASSVGGQNASVIVDRNERDGVKAQLENATNDDQRREASDELARMDKAEASLKASRKTVLGRLDDPKFIAGFGSNGGEEFLSYLNISESLVLEGGDDWETWDRNITRNLNRIQNNDGSWTGHHCITGRTFCTASALLVMMTDRCPVPVGTAFAQR